MVSGEEESIAGDAGLNRLSRESSPYLRQHAGNPVDWYPWGDAAFELVRDYAGGACGPARSVGWR